MKHLIWLREKAVKITDLAGSWNITDEEIKEIKASASEFLAKGSHPILIKNEFLRLLKEIESHISGIFCSKT